MRQGTRKDVTDGLVWQCSQCKTTKCIRAGDAALDRVLRGFDIIAWRNDCATNNVYAGSLIKVVGSQGQMEIS